MVAQKTRQKIVQAFATILGEEGWEAASPARAATDAGVSLSAMRAEFPTRISLLAALLSNVDQQVLDAVDASMAEEPAKDRLFDVILSRLDHMAPYKASVRALKAAVRRDPMLALEINPVAATSMRWMLTAAGIEPRGLRGRMMVQGLVVAFARILDTWLEDDDPGLARTMAAVDRELTRGADWLGRMGRLEKLVRPLAEKFTGRRGRRRAPDAPGDEGEIAGAGI
ncbi:TetR/AcrR family transcriptional regulator [Stappia sp. F7233]|uniref:TetR/AcrR family transcriptional regulator n=1 Tax=Stappia albiluteola TaxID=2758565 RepID=A0A839A8A8_9HYPH|nr:TetR/AcrR family transcriptional regulator [Stappia albiluteola]MBA5775763.1 TetR/AcrR family transcriptional regulator [Stappia albiluteola]